MVVVKVKLRGESNVVCVLRKQVMIILILVVADNTKNVLVLVVLY